MLILPRPPRDLARNIPKIVHQFDSACDGEHIRTVIAEEEWERSAIAKYWFSALIHLTGSRTLDVTSRFIEMAECQKREQLESDRAAEASTILRQCESLERSMLENRDEALREQICVAFNCEIEVALIVSEAHSRSRARISDREAAVARFLQQTMSSEMEVRFLISEETNRRRAMRSAFLNSINYLIQLCVTGGKNILFCEASSIMAAGPLHLLFIKSATLIQAQWRGYVTRKTLLENEISARMTL